MAKKDTIDINTLNELAVSVRDIGIRKTKNLLSSAKSDPVKYVVEMLVNDTSKEFCVAKSRIFSYWGGGRRIQAISTIIYLLRKHLVLDYQSIYNYLPDLNITKPRISHYVNYINNLSEMVKPDKEVLDKFRAIEILLLENMKSIKTTSNN